MLPVRQLRLWPLLPVLPGRESVPPPLEQGRERQQERAPVVASWVLPLQPEPARVREPAQPLARHAVR